jgi:tetratricopeptide (TPR) repeat protein
MKGTALIVFLALAHGSSADSPSVLEQAVALRHAGDLDGARRILDRAGQSGEATPEVRAELGAVLLELDEPGLAANELSRALESEPRADTAFNLSIARYRLKQWEEAWKACNLCLKWGEAGSRLQERAAEIGVAIAARLEERERREEVYAEIAKWAGETEGGKRAAEELK